MTRKITAANIFESLYVDLWGNGYKLRNVTRSVSERLREAQTTAEALDEQTATSDELAAAIITVVDILLEPNVETAQSAGEVLAELWDKDELGLDWLNAFAETVQEEAGARRRPTSVRTTNG